MNELIKKILALPELHLSTSDWSELTNLVNFLEVKDIAHLSRQIDDDNDTPNIKNAKAKIIKFMTAWFDLTLDMTMQLRHIAEIYEEEMHKKLGADNSLPLLIELLPNNIKLVTDVLAKLEHAAQVNDSSALGYALITFYSIFAAKKSDLETLQEANDIELRNTVNRLQKREEVKHLLIGSNDFKMSLANKLIQNLKQNDETAYLTYAKNDINAAATESDEKVVDAILSNHQESLLTLNKPELQIYLDQYRIITDIIYTLIRPTNTSIQILEEFSAKFQYHQSTLQQTSDPSVKIFLKSSRQYYGIKFFVDIFGTKTRREAFFDLANNTSMANDPLSHVKEPSQPSTAPLQRSSL